MLRNIFFPEASCATAPGTPEKRKTAAIARNICIFFIVHAPAHCIFLLSWDIYINDSGRLTTHWRNGLDIPPVPVANRSHFYKYFWMKVKFFLIRE
jgi:hypothetical protein